MGLQTTDGLRDKWFTLCCGKCYNVLVDDLLAFIYKEVANLCRGKLIVRHLCSFTCNLQMFFLSFHNKFITAISVKFNVTGCV